MNERTQGQAGGSREKARDRMRRTAAETVEIARSGVYAYRGQSIDIRAAQRLSEEGSRLITPERGAEIVRTLAGRSGSLRTDYRVVNESAVKTVRELAVGGAGLGEVAGGESVGAVRDAAAGGAAAREAEQGEAGREAGRSEVAAGGAGGGEAVREAVGEGRIGEAVREAAAGGAVIAGTGRIGLLNFASAKNPGGGFLNGATAQEENLAISSGLYLSQLRNAGYYDANRACGSMMYTHHAIYSPDVVFFRDERFELAPPVCASVLTLPAVNYGQVLLKGEDADQAKIAMLERMRLALAIFAERGDRTIVLGAYGCGVFRNDPAEVASWWRRLLDGEGWSAHFEQVVFAVLDRSQDGRTLRPFERIWGRAL
ncbi:TIGR02452 family protein [Saccharibacillus brassicae]|uniref:TIGR02452 family protein n=1 Tax=Saccharibacillus brassicae TaxID=2583377 RepID=UPI00319DC6A9